MAELKLIKLSEIQSEPVDWLWEPYIPRGAITLIQGDGGEGKTTVTLAIAAAVSTGAALPGSGSTVPGGVVFQNAEDSYAKTIKPKLELFGADCDLIECIDETDEALFLADKRIEDAIIEISAQLCVIDPVQAYLGGANMNSANGVRPLMKRLGDVAVRTGCAILLVGHLNKGKGRSTYRGLGSIDIYAAARSVLTVGKIPVDENMRAIVHNKSNLAPAGKPQAFGLDPAGGFCWLGDYDITIDELLGGKKQQQPESQYAKARRLIESALANGPVPAVDMEQLADEQGISFKTFKRAKEALGVISFQRGRVWYWDLPIVAGYTECTTEGQSCSEGQTTALVPLNSFEPQRL